MKWRDSMKVVYVLDGQVYHENKAGFKEILNKHKVRWAGRYGVFKWKGGQIEVVASYEGEEGVIKSAKIELRFSYENKAVTELVEWLERHGKLLVSE
ncbi:MAG: hypothetical protein R6U44_10560 [Archaeoglobaceae archaeon]